MFNFPRGQEYVAVVVYIMKKLVRGGCVKMTTGEKGRKLHKNGLIKGPLPAVATKYAGEKKNHKRGEGG